MKSLITNIKLFIWLAVLLGFVYPLFITAISLLIDADKAKGSLIIIKNEIKGSNFIAQKFTLTKYFWPRPSTVDYNTLPASGSNLGPTSKELLKLFQERKKFILQNHISYEIPAELLFASGSGIDPHISPKTALYQVDRVIKARNMDPIEDKQKIIKLINNLIIIPRLGFIGPPIINVLRLNLALDDLNKNPNTYMNNTP